MPVADLPLVSLSSLDEERFGIPSARATLTRSDQVAETVEFCQKAGVIFLIARCATDSLNIVHRLEQTGFTLMDTLLYYYFDFERTIVPDEPDVLPIRPIRPNKPEDVEGVGAAAAEAFRNYTGHYHADPRLPAAKCDEVYVSWATRACTIAGMSDTVLIAERDDQIVGFSVLRLHSAAEGEMQLYGVAPSARGLGLSRALVVRSLEWFKVRGARRMITSTQVTNFASQYIWGRLGLVADHAFYTFHKWFD